MATEESNFRFVSVQNPDDAGDRTARRLARSHAIKHALESKRKLQQQSTLNFRVPVTPFKENPSKSASRAQLTYILASLPPLSRGALDPFQMLGVDPSKLRVWLGQNETRRAIKPVFSIADELILPNFRLLFRAGLDDPAFLNAIMLTFSFAVTGVIDSECLRYQSQALNFIRVRMNFPDEATSESTLAAILLLVGVDARLTMPSQVQLHMNAVQQLLNICQTQNVCLTDGIKRAIFWQDLTSSVMTGSKRIVHHTTFAELEWRRDPFTPNAYTVPTGFEKVSYLLTEELVEVLKDLHALQYIRDFARFTGEDMVSMARVDNHQASIQSRLAMLVSSPGVSSFLDCCHLAAYLCSATLRCKIWPASVVPSHLSLRLLRELQQANGDSVWDEHPDVLLWSLYVGGAFAPVGSVRSEYVVLLRLNQHNRFRDRYESWPELLEVLREFIWSEKAFTSSVKAFWEEVSPRDM
ncbi:hypothetical protein F5Y04DRAFT_264105 [Hypomontagnella monticulosa]|nr:hypothetical protein F5Y04DRAFT_264105 [Hypomontagnella monticulosa]